MGRNNGNDWQILVLLHDESSRQVAEFFTGIYPIRIGKFPKRIKRLNPKKKIIKNIEHISKKTDLNGGRVLTLAGAGGKHQYTYGLCKVFADKKSKGYGYIHFDLHDDTKQIIDNLHIGCASFVQHLLEDGGKVEKIFYVGCCQEVSLPNVIAVKNFQDKIILKNYKNVMEESARDLMAPLKNFPEDVYVSMDLDVLEKKDIHTGFGYGKLSLEKLIQCIEIIKSEKNIIGADVLGYETEKLMEKGTKTYKKAYEENKQKSLKTYKAIVDCLLG